MKKLNIIKKVSLALTVFMATVVFNQLQAQKYGGSAYAHVKDDKGKTRVVVSQTPCVWASESEAKQRLQPNKAYNENLDSQIYYSIDKCYDNDNKKYGGSSSVRVRNDKGETRVVTATTPCVWNNVSEAKEKLTPNKAYNEEFIEGVSYDIDSCN